MIDNVLLCSIVYARARRGELGLFISGAASSLHREISMTAVGRSFLLGRTILYVREHKNPADLSPTPPSQA